LLQSNFRLLEDRLFISNLGIKKLVASRRLKSLQKSFIQNSDGTYRYTELEKGDTKLANFLMSMLISKPAFNNDELFRDFVAILRSTGLLQREETSEFAKLKIPIGLHVITILHGCRIKISDSEKFRLQFHIDLKRHIFSIIASVPTHNIGEQNQISTASDMFSLIADPDIWCAPDFLTTPVDDEFPAIEVNENQQIDFIH